MATVGGSEVSVEGRQGWQGSPKFDRKTNYRRIATTHNGMGIVNTTNTLHLPT